MLYPHYKRKFNFFRIHMNTPVNNEIHQFIPHREPFLFIDNIKEIRADGAVTIRTIRAEEPQFQGHYPGNSIMPGVLLCEAVFQTASIYLAKKLEKKGIDIKTNPPVLSRISDAKFKSIVKPGDVLEIEAKIKETIGKFYFMTGAIRKAGKLVMSVTCALALIDESE